MLNDCGEQFLPARKRSRKVTLMRLEPIGRLEMQYDPKAAWLRPYGEKEGAGFGFGSGRMVGPRLQGSVIWANHPRRREDGVWCPDCH